MDIILLNQIKKVTERYSRLSTSGLQSHIDDIQSKIEMLAKEIFEIKVEKLKDNITFAHQHNLIKYVKHLTQIVLILINEQNNRAFLTKRGMRAGDCSYYFKQNNESCDRNDLIENEKVNKIITKIINDRKNVYINTFGYFKDKEEAYYIIKKEFNDVTSLLININDIKYNNFDNFDPLINKCQNLIYELIQLIVGLIKADESNIANTLDNFDIYNMDAYFLLMDFVNSKKLYFEDRCEILYENIKKLNKIIESESEVGLICKMNLLKQDEVQGVFVGDIEKLLNIIENEIVNDIRVAYGKFKISDKLCGIKNIFDSVYDKPYELFGPATWNARDMIEKHPILIRSK